MVEAIEQLKGDRPKILGFDYYNIIYSSCFLLSICMIIVYYFVDDLKVRKMVLT